MAFETKQYISSQTEYLLSIAFILDNRNDEISTTDEFNEGYGKLWEHKVHSLRPLVV